MVSLRTTMRVWSNRVSPWGIRDIGGTAEIVTSALASTILILCRAILLRLLFAHALLTNFFGRTICSVELVLTFALIDLQAAPPLIDRSDTTTPSLYERQGFTWRSFGGSALKIFGAAYMVGDTVWQAALDK